MPEVASCYNGSETALEPCGVSFSSLSLVVRLAWLVHPYGGEAEKEIREREKDSVATWHCSKSNWQNTC